MSARFKDIDVYIANAQPFARAILARIRALFRRACPDVEETIKWRAPSFQYKGMLGGMAAFKNHVAWRLWKAAMLTDPHGIMADRAKRSGGRADEERARSGDVQQLQPVS